MFGIQTLPVLHAKHIEHALVQFPDVHNLFDCFHVSNMYRSTKMYHRWENRSTILRSKSNYMYWLAVILRRFHLQLLLLGPRIAAASVWIDGNGIYLSQYHSPMDLLVSCGYQMYILIFMCYLLCIGTLGSIHITQGTPRRGDISL